MRKFAGILFFLVGSVLALSSLMNVTTFLRLFQKLVEPDWPVDGEILRLTVGRGLAAFLFGLLSFRSFRAAKRRFSDPVEIERSEPAKDQ